MQPNVYLAPAALVACLHGMAANLFVLCAAARHDCLPLSARRRGTFFCVAKRKYPKKRRPGAARNPAQKHNPQAPPNSPRANVTRLKQIGCLKPGGCTFVRLAPTGYWRFTHILPSSTAQPPETAHSLQAKRAGEYGAGSVNGCSPSIISASRRPDTGPSVSPRWLWPKQNHKPG